MDTDNGAGGAQQLNGLHGKELGELGGVLEELRASVRVLEKVPTSSRAQLEVEGDGKSLINQWRVHP